MGTGSSKFDKDGDEFVGKRLCDPGDSAHVGNVSKNGLEVCSGDHSQSKHWKRCRWGVEKKMESDEQTGVRTPVPGKYQCSPKPLSRRQLRRLLKDRVTPVAEIGPTLEHLQRQARAQAQAGTLPRAGFNMDKRRRSRRRRSRSKCKRGRVRGGSRCKRKPGPKRRSRSRKRSRSRRRSRKVSRKRRSHTSVAMSRARANQRRRRSRRRSRRR